MLDKKPSNTFKKYQKLDFKGESWGIYEKEHLKYWGFGLEKIEIPCPAHTSEIQTFNTFIYHQS